MRLVTGSIKRNILKKFILYVLATRPLLRQIENLQATYAAQTASYERVEKNLTDRLGALSTIPYTVSSIAKLCCC